MSEPNIQAMPSAAVDQPSAPTDEEIYRACIGKNADVMAPRAKSHRHFNVFALLFPGFYFLYRKMYVAGIVLALVELLFSLILLYPNLVVREIAGLVILVLHAVCGIAFYQLYDRCITTKVASFADFTIPANMVPKATYYGGTSGKLTALAVIVCVFVFLGCLPTIENAYSCWKPIVSKSIDILSDVSESKLAKDVAYAEEHNWRTDYEFADEVLERDGEIDFAEYCQSSEEAGSLSTIYWDHTVIDSLAFDKEDLEETNQNDLDAVRAIYETTGTSDTKNNLLLLIASVNWENQMSMPWELPAGVWEFVVPVEFDTVFEHPFSFDYAHNDYRITYQDVGNFYAAVLEGTEIVDGGRVTDDQNYCKIQSTGLFDDRYMTMRLVSKEEAENALERASKEDTTTVGETYIEYEHDGISCEVAVCEVEGKYIVLESYDCTIGDWAPMTNNYLNLMDSDSEYRLSGPGFDLGFGDEGEDESEDDLEEDSDSE